MKNIKELIEYPKEGILSKKITDFDVTLFCMAKGTKISEHTSSKKAIVYVLEGNGTFTTNKEIKMQEGVMITLEKNAPHSLEVKENTSFLLILM